MLIFLGLVVYLGYGMRHSQAGCAIGTGADSAGGLLASASSAHWGSTGPDHQPIVSREGE